MARVARTEVRVATTAATDRRVAKTALSRREDPRWRIDRRAPTIAATVGRVEMIALIGRVPIRDPAATIAAPVVLDQVAI